MARPLPVLIQRSAAMPPCLPTNDPSCALRRIHHASIDAIHLRRKVVLTFYSSENSAVLSRTCAPMDFGPSRRAKDGTDRYHFWDYDSDTRPHPIALLPERVVDMVVLDDQFDPEAFVTWDLARSPWWIIRDWGAQG